ncbi:MAG: hypothetical protein P4L51_23675 [Puia sp.]|nr:hypothetical protein [Puia sp.]
MKTAKHRNSEMPVVFTRHVDSMNSWLEVHYFSLVELKLTALISGASYRDGDTVYLEEDGDASLFRKAWYRYMQNRGMDVDIEVEEIFDGQQSFIAFLPPYHS